jgi:hypothetical protein
MTRAQRNDQLNIKLDNSVLGKVTGWLRFVGLKEVVKLDLVGDFHRDIRGTKVRLRNPNPSDQGRDGGRPYLEGFSLIQTGEVGDMTAGLPPQDYVSYPYFEFYSEPNGRVVLELDQDQIEVIGTPIPAVESDPISRAEQEGKMAKFLAGMGRELQVPVVLVKPHVAAVSDPEFTHWVVEGGTIVGEARNVEPDAGGISMAFVRLFSVPEMAEFGSVESDKLHPKSAPSAKDARP